jgi:hypothetical protein
MLVDAYLQSLAEAGAGGRPLPEVEAILRRARLRERLEAEQRRVDRATLPLLVVALLGPAAGLVTVVLQPSAASATAVALATAFAALAGTFAVRLALIED